MLFKKEYISKSTLIGVWKIEETCEEFLSSLVHYEWVQVIESIKSESRVLEILATRILLKELTGEEREVRYTPSGKPYLADSSYHISVSHTRGYVAVAIDKEHPLGLDIEQITEKIRRVQSRVVSAEEYIDPNNELIHLLLHWSAKEAMFKYIDADGVDFLKHLFVDKFIPQSKGEFEASEKRTENGTNFRAYYRVEENFVLVCICSQ